MIIADALMACWILVELVAVFVPVWSWVDIGTKFDTYGRWPLALAMDWFAVEATLFLVVSVVPCAVDL